MMIIYAITKAITELMIRENLLDIFSFLLLNEVELNA